MNEYQQRQKYISLLYKWWVIDNGWNPRTLERKSLRELMGIHARAVRDGWPVKQRPWRANQNQQR